MFEEDAEEDAGNDAGPPCAICGRTDKPMAGKRCTSHECKQAYSKRNKQRLDGTSPSATVVPSRRQVEPTFCFKVSQVFGHRDCDICNLTACDIRNGRETTDDEMEYLVRGRFAEHGDDSGFLDTRWVQLSELIDYIDEGDEGGLKLLDQYASKLQKRAKESRKRLRLALS